MRPVLTMEPVDGRLDMGHVLAGDSVERYASESALTHTTAETVTIVVVLGVFFLAKYNRADRDDFALLTFAMLWMTVRK